VVTVTSDAHTVARLDLDDLHLELGWQSWRAGDRQLCVPGLVRTRFGREASQPSGHIRAISCEAFPGVAVHLWLGRDSICRSGALPRQTGWPVARAGMRRNRVDSPISASRRASGAPRQ
jgi:hypothetical protein